MNSTKVKDVKRILTRDIDPGDTDVAKLDAFVAKCELAATDALARAPVPGYTDFETDQIIEVLHGLRRSHETIRELLRKGHTVAAPVDALAIARLQLESLYSACRMLQDAEAVRTFVKNGWKQRYVSFLLLREECGGLQRFSEYFQAIAVPHFEQIRQMAGVSDDEKLTIEFDELGVQVPARFVRVPIKQFPTPKKVIEETRNAEQKQMLRRLYPEYQYLCSFAHGSSASSMMKSALDERSPTRRYFTTSQVEDVFQHQVGEPAVIYSVLSVVQAAAEITAFFPSDIELHAKVAEAWRWLANGSLLARVIWEIRTKKLLNDVGL